MEEFGRIYLMSGEMLMVLTVLVPGVASAEAGYPIQRNWPVIVYSLAYQYRQHSACAIEIGFGAEDVILELQLPISSREVLWPSLEAARSLVGVVPVKMH